MISLNHTTKKPLYQQIYEQFRDQIMDGTYAVGTKLPPIRRLASDLEISRNTVESAYTQLTQEGYVASRTGSGFVVEALDLLTEGMQTRQVETSDAFIKRLRQTSLWVDQPASAPALASATAAAHTALAPATAPASASAPAAATPRNPSNRTPSAASPAATAAVPAAALTYDFTYGSLQKGSFPAHIWRRLTNDILQGSDAWKASTYTDSLGEPRLREQIAHMLHINSGVHCHPSQVVVQAGTQASLYNLLTLFDPLRDVIAMEEPGYDGARSVFENARFRLFPVAVHEGNDAFIDGLYNSHARLAYVTPSNQFPTGSVLQLSARQKLLRWASRENAYIIEDDYCREFRYNSRPLPSLQSLDRDERVIYMGTFSKALSPALRMNYLVLPTDLLFEWHKLFANHYPEVPWLSQAVLESYLEKGYWDKHLRKMQAINKRKYQLLSSALLKHMGERVDVMENGSGLHLLVGVLDGRRQQELIEAAARAGVRVYGTSRYWMSERHPLENYVLVGFSAITEDLIEPGIEQLAHAWFG